ncbi:MAG TPA: N-acetylmuramoyl-L-alanine amidase, partial [Vicinamibacterales bacterium]
MIKTLRIGAALLLALTLGPVVDIAAAAPGAATLYSRALGRERELRNAVKPATLTQLRSAVNAYEAIVRRYPASGYSDNALWQGGNLALLAYERFGKTADKETAVRLLTQLKSQYPSSSLVARVDDAVRSADTVHTASAPPARAATKTAASSSSAAGPTTAPAADTPAAPAPPSGPIALRDIKRTQLPDGMRVSIELDGESAYRSERLDNPRRVFFDLQGVKPIGPLQDATLKFDDDVVREIRLGRHPQNTTRVVMDMEGVDSYSVFTLYEPFRLVIDFKATAPRPAPTSGTATTSTAGAAPKPALVPSVQPAPVTPPLPMTKAPVEDDPPVVVVETKPAIPSRPVVSATALPPAVPAANANGKFSLARQLGLGVSRIVIDAGHGGHDPGAHGNGVVEAELVLDVAQRLNKLVQKQGIEVVMTRDSDVFIPLEERTAIANREGADLFLSIHANAARNPQARGVETYFLNFASNPEAEAVAARENSASGRTMHSLPEIVRAIALNNKLDESRDFADMVQKSMVRRLSARNKLVKDLGVKQAPFVVLIGAAMPSILAEISFVTHQQEGRLLKSG